MQQRKLGSQGLVVPAIGLGCMGMTAFYGSHNRQETEADSLKTLAKALELGVNFLDTAWIYQSFGAGGGENYTNEELIGKAIAIHGRDKFIIATKFGIAMSPTGMVFSGKPDFIQAQLQDSLTRLGTDYIDLYYMHRMDPSTPIEETMECLKSLVEQGKIKYIGLSECTPSELRRAHAVHPISAIQMEWSLQTRDIEDTVLPVARELGIGIVPYSPLGRKLLTGTVKTAEDLDKGDWRLTQPRFNGDNLEKNVPLSFFEIAQRKGCTPAQLALAWVLSRGDDVVPIPGTKSAERLIENAAAVGIILSEAEQAEIEASVPAPVGDRYAGESDIFLLFRVALANR